MGIIKYLNLEDSEVFIFDEFIINQIKEGVIIEPKHNDLLNDIVQEYFSSKDMVYISNRTKSYSVNPLIYPEAEKIPNLIAIAIIPKTQNMRRSAEFEAKFYDKPYKIFNRLHDAIIWVTTIISESKSKKNSDSSEQIES